MNLKKILLLSLIFVVLLSCQKKSSFIDLSDYVQEYIIDDDIYVRYISHNIIDDSLRIVYCDDITESLKYATFTDDGYSSVYIDKVDTEDKNNANMGVHGFTVAGNYEYLVYEEYKSEKQMYFKVINRRQGKQSWTVDTVSINPGEFLSFSHNNDMFILYTLDGVIVKQYDDGLVPVNYDDDTKGLYGLKVLKQRDTNLFYLYCFDDNQLNQRILQISKDDNYTIETKSSTHIGQNIKIYNACLSQDNQPYVIYFNDIDHTLKFNEPGNTSQLLGYFNTVYALESIIFNGELFFIVSGIVPDENDALSYQISIIYKADKDIWHEGQLIRTETPISRLNVTQYHDKLYLIYGSNSLTIAEINTGFM